MSDYGGDDAGDESHLLKSLPLSYEAYEPEEPHFDDEEPIDGGLDPDDPENARNGVNDANEDGANTDSKAPNGIVEVGQDASANRNGQKNAAVGTKEKKIPKEQRSTTPYMTKYERARVLGTRALQIRYETLYGGGCRKAGAKSRV
ncbi:MAG: hypothetical protein Q9171_003913 [Xanthocarpia ochracea]